MPDYNTYIQYFLPFFSFLLQLFELWKSKSSSKMKVYFIKLGILKLNLGNADCQKLEWRFKDGFGEQWKEDDFANR